MLKIFPEIDYLTVHTPLTDETRHLVDAAALEILKPGVRMVNCARGGIYDEQALLKGLQSGVIAGVALDVFEEEPCTESPVFGGPGVLHLKSCAMAPPKGHAATMQLLAKASG